MSENDLDVVALARSLSLAKKLVLRRKRLAKLTELGAPTQIVDHERRMVAESEQEVAADLYASDLLDQVDLVCAMTDNRERALLNETCLGKIHESLLGLMQELEVGVEFLGEAKTVEEMCHLLHDSISNGDGKCTVAVLLALVLDLKWDLVYTKLPQVPPIYEYRRQQLQPKDIN